MILQRFISGDTIRIMWATTRGVQIGTVEVVDHRNGRLWFDSAITGPTVVEDTAIIKAERINVTRSGKGASNE